MRPFSALSGGQERKLRLVRRILDAPNVLVRDEPAGRARYRKPGSSRPFALRGSGVYTESTWAAYPTDTLREQTGASVTP